MPNKFLKSDEYPPSEDTFFIANNIENEKGACALDIGSGSGYALAAARAFITSGEKNPEKVVKASLKITSDICIYTNDRITVLKA